ncbi:MAG: hypothetical protein RL154_1285 [Pseudomonadota bacterium]|jgi:cell division protein FtsW
MCVVDKTLFFLMILAASIGVVFSYSLSTYIVWVSDYMPIHFLIRQFGAAVFGIFIIWGLSKLDPDIWLGRIGLILFFGFFALMLAMPILPSSLVPMVNGAKRWIRLGGLNISPVEFFKIGFVYFLAWSMTRKFYLPERAPTLADEIKIFAPYIAIFGIVAFLVVVLQNDLGQAVIMAATMIVMLVFANGSFKLFLSLLISGFVFAIGFIAFSSYRLGKVLQWWASIQEHILGILPAFFANYLRIESTSLDEAYQATQALNAIDNGGIFGEGLGNSIYKLGFLSDVHTDFILAGIIEELGFFGAFMVSAIILAIVFRIFRIANRLDMPVFHLFCVGIGAQIAFQFLMNSLGISGVMPIKGITVPFISYGGSSLLAFSVAIGMVIMASKKARL